MSNRMSATPAHSMSALEKNLLGVRLKDAPILLPGVVVAVLLAWLSVVLSRLIGVSLLGFDRSPISPVMLSISLGLIFGAVSPIPGVLRPGLKFTVSKVLRLGIILLGIRLTIFDLFRLGVYGVPIVAICVAGALFFSVRINRWLDLPERLGTLIAVGTSICGVSAIVATGAAIDADDEEVAYAVAVITIFGLTATLIYPYLANLVFDGQPLSVGLFMGTAIHDTSQVVGAAKVYADVYSAPGALDVATVTKLVRNLFMAAVIPFMALSYGRGRARRGRGGGFFRLLPLFVVGFVAMSVFRSVGDAGIKMAGLAFGIWDKATWAEIYTVLQKWAGYLLVVALAGVGLSTDLRTLKGLGIKPFFVGLGAAVVVGVISFAAISLMGSLVAL